MNQDQNNFETNGAKTGDNTSARQVKPPTNEASPRFIGAGAHVERGCDGSPSSLEPFAPPSTINSELSTTFAAAAEIEPRDASNVIAIEENSGRALPSFAFIEHQRRPHSGHQPSTTDHQLLQRVTTSSSARAGDNNAEADDFNVGQGGSPLTEPASPTAAVSLTKPESGGRRAEVRNANYADLKIANERKAVCEQFLKYQREDHYSLNQAAAACGKSPSWFSGADSMLARYQRDGLAGVLPHRAPSTGIGELTSRIEALPWFVAAARFFYLLSNHRRHGGSVPDAVQRVISLPNLPPGWTHGHTARFLRAIGQSVLPTFPEALREIILARQKAGTELVPERIRKQIAVNASVVQLFRSPKAWSLDTQSAPGSQRRFFNKETCAREIMLPGDWFGGDDATPGIAVCVPCNAVITPCSEKFGVLLGRFQWLAFHDARTDKLLAWDYVVRPRGSYRAEDILNGMGTVVRTHGVPRKGFQFEGGTFNSKLVRQAIELLHVEHWRTYSPHQKAIESIFNRVWTRLAVQFPHADMGRYRNENEANCRIYELCKKGGQDPRKYFPTIDQVTAAFDDEVKHHNTKKIFSEQYGQWVPDEFFGSVTAEHKLAPFDSDAMGWIFSPYAVERKVNHMIVKCRVPMFENFSVPFEFNAPWLPLHHGKRIRMHFNPREPKCTAKIVLLENSGTATPNTVLGDAQLIGETSGHIRLIMGWGNDDQRAGYIARQKTNNFMRRVSRGIGAGGRVTYSADEQRDGIAGVDKVEKLNNFSSNDSSGCGGHGGDQLPGKQKPGRETVPAPLVPTVISDEEFAELDRIAKKIYT